MQCDEDCRTAGFGKTERPVGWEGDGELSMVKLVRHCERGKPAGTDRLHLQALSHSFTLDFVVLHEEREVVEQSREIISEWLKEMGLELKESKTRIVHTLEITEGETGFEFLGFQIKQYPAGKHNTDRNGQ